MLTPPKNQLNKGIFALLNNFIIQSQIWDHKYYKENYHKLLN